MILSSSISGVSEVVAHSVDATVGRRSTIRPHRIGRSLSCRPDVGRDVDDDAATVAPGAAACIDLAKGFDLALVVTNVIAIGQAPRHAALEVFEQHVIGAFLARRIGDGLGLPHDRLHLIVAHAALDSLHVAGRHGAAGGKAGHR